MYIYMNKEENRIVTRKIPFHSVILSGELSVLEFPVSFNPLVVTGTLREKFCNMFTDLKMVKVDLEETFSRNYFKNKEIAYEWLLHEETGQVYCVWDGHHSTPSNCSKLLKEGVVRINCVGTNFKCESFKVFKFQGE